MAKIPDNTTIQQADVSNPSRPVAAGALPNLRAQRLPASPPNISFQPSRAPEIMKREREQEMAYLKIRQDSALKTKEMLSNSLMTMSENLNRWVVQSERAELRKSSNGLRAEQIQINAEFAKRTDYENFDEDYTKAMEKARDRHGENLWSSGTKEFYESESNLLLQAGRSKMAERAHGLEADHEIAQSGERINNAFDAAIASGDNEQMAAAIQLADDEWEYLYDKNYITETAKNTGKRETAKTLFSASLQALDEDDEQQERMVMLEYFKASGMVGGEDGVISTLDWQTEKDDTAQRIELIGIRTNIGIRMQALTDESGEVDWTTLRNEASQLRTEELRDQAQTEISELQGLSNAAKSMRQARTFKSLYQGMMFGDKDGKKITFNDIPDSTLRGLEPAQVNSLQSVSAGIGSGKSAVEESLIRTQATILRERAEKSLGDPIKVAEYLDFTSSNLPEVGEGHRNSAAAMLEGNYDWNVPAVETEKEYLDRFFRTNGVEDDARMDAISDRMTVLTYDHVAKHKEKPTEKEWSVWAKDLLFEEALKPVTVMGVGLWDSSVPLYASDQGFETYRMQQGKLSEREEARAYHLWKESHGKFPESPEDINEARKQWWDKTRGY